MIKWWRKIKANKIKKMTPMLDEKNEAIKRKVKAALTILERRGYERRVDIDRRKESFDYHLKDGLEA